MDGDLGAPLLGPRISGHLPKTRIASVSLCAHARHLSRNPPRKRSSLALVARERSERRADQDANMRSKNVGQRRVCRRRRAQKKSHASCPSLPELSPTGRPGS
jgi:hypothetical protein